MDNFGHSVLQCVERFHLLTEQRVSSRLQRYMCSFHAFRCSGMGHKGKLIIRKWFGAWAFGNLVSAIGYADKILIWGLETSVENANANREESEG